MKETYCSLWAGMCSASTRCFCIKFLDCFHICVQNCVLTQSYNVEGQFPCYEAVMNSVISKTKREYDIIDVKNVLNGDEERLLATSCFWKSQ